MLAENVRFVLSWLPAGSSASIEIRMVFAGRKKASGPQTACRIIVLLLVWGVPSPEQRETWQVSAGSTLAGR